MAVHRKGSGKNVHAHIVFSESELLPEPEIKIASRNMFYDENGKHCRTKKEIFGEDGHIRPGCRIIKKGEVYKIKYFKGKREDLKSNQNAYFFKQHYAKLLDLKVFDRDSYQLAQIKYGKGNPKEDEIKEYNAEVQEYNRVLKEGIEKGVISKETAVSKTSEFRELRKGFKAPEGKTQHPYRLEQVLSAFKYFSRITLAIEKISQKENLGLSRGTERKPSVREQLERMKQQKEVEDVQSRFSLDRKNSSPSPKPARRNKDYDLDT